MQKSTARGRIDARPMNRFQWFVIGLATVLMGLDGYDVQAMAFTANAVTQDFGLTGSQLGLLLSGGLIGMALGAVFVGPFADRFGRRPLLLTAIAVNGLGLFLSATATTMPELMVWRVVTGLGVGGILVSGTVLVSEYSNARFRGLALSIYAAGYPVGATLGGLAAVPLISTFGWQAVFLLGAAVTVVSVVVVALAMPESLDFLEAQALRTGSARTLRRAERILARLGLEEEVRAGDVAAGTDAVPGNGDPEAEGRGRQSGGGFGALLAPTRRRSTLMLWAMFFFVMFGFYFANTWTPQLLTEVGFSPEEGIFGGVMLTTGGIVGAVLYGVFAARWDVRRVLAVFALLSAVMFVVFISSTGVLGVALITGVLLGMIINGCISGLYTIAPMTYAPHLRSTGVGVALGVGRTGAIVAPIVVGALLDAGWTPFALYLGVAGVVMLAAWAGMRIRLHQQQADDLPDQSQDEDLIVDEHAAPDPQGPR
ncbi:MAG: MFS transporter [Nesterenkonia sp.]|nr:MFS transporter [Nesterenkonia sp.]